MSAGVALGILGLLLVVLGGIALYVSKRTGEVHSLWFGSHPENIARFERAYLVLGIASLIGGAFITMLGVGSMVLDSLSS